MAGEQRWFPSVWVRQAVQRTRERGGRTELSRAQIVRATMELLDEQGLEALSMRKLAAKLSSGATSLYWYVETKDELLDLALDEAFGEISLPDPETVGWRNAATALAYGLRETIFRHPWMGAVMGSRPNVGPNALRLAEQVTRVFTHAGFDESTVDHAASAVMAYAVGATLPHAAWQAAVQRSGMPEEAWWEGLRKHVGQAAADHPELRTLLPDPGRAADLRVTRQLCFDFGLAALLDGLEARLRRPSAGQAAQAPAERA